MQTPVVGFVWQIVSDTGTAAFPVSTVAVIEALAPTLTVATENAPRPLGPGMLTMPSCVNVAPSATISGPRVSVTVNCSVFTPGSAATGNAFVHWNVNSMSVASIGTKGVKVMTNDCPLPLGIVAGVFGCPTGTLAE